ncbi:MAG: hypothetical protein ABRQ38_12550 [Candidatus Eremiobacterota bacterium]
MKTSIIIGIISLILVSLFIGCGGDSTVQVITTPTTTTVTATPTGTTATATPTTTTTTGSDGVYTQNGGTVSQKGKSYRSTADDISAVTIDSSGTFTLTDSTITKSGNTSSADNSSFYGLNAGVLVKGASKMTLSNSKVTTTGTGANGIFAYGSDSEINVSDTTVICTAQLGHAVMASGGGKLTVSNVNMTTEGANSGAIATDRGGGTISVTGGNVTTSGADAPGIYSTGTITVSGATISATGSEGAVIEGANSIILTDTSLSSSKTNKWGVLIYQSMSGDAEGTQGTFTMTGGSLAHTAEDGPLFYVTNSTGIITLKGVNVTASSGIIIKASTGNWGTSGSNGGKVNFTADSQSLTGNLLADSSSTITAVLQNGSALNGYINSANSASAINLTMDSSSTWNVTADSYLTCLTDTGGISGTTITNITGNGYTVYYSSSGCPELGGQTYTLNGGGSLVPR